MKSQIKSISIGLISWPMIVIFLAFFFAKIFNLIDWSWWIIFSPLWIVPIGLICFGILLIIAYLTLILMNKLWKL